MRRFYIKDIKKLDSSKFGSIKIDGKEYKGAAAKKYVAGLAEGGKSVWQIGEKLKKSGISGYQYGQRERIKNLLSNSNKGFAEGQKKADIKISMQRDMSGIDNRRMYNRGFAAASAKSVSPAANKNGAGNPGINKGSAGFAGSGAPRPIDNSATVP